MSDWLTVRAGARRARNWTPALILAGTIGALSPVLAAAGSTAGPDGLDTRAVPGTELPTGEGPGIQVDLRAAIDLALQNNPELSATRRDVEVGSARRDVARAGLWPVLDGSAGVTEYRREQRIVPPGAPDAPTAISHQFAWAQIEASVPLVRGGQTWASVRAAERSLKATRHRSDRSRGWLVFEVSRLYHEILAQREYCASIAVAEESLRSQSDAIEALVRERKAAPVDGQRVQVRLAALELARQREENQLTMQERTLAVLLGQDGRDQPVEVVGTLSPAAPDQLPGAQEAVDEALSRRPDYLAARDALDSLTEQGAATRAELLPELWLQGSYGVRWALWPTSITGDASPVADVGEASLVLTVPLLEGGKVRAEVREQDAQIAAARERLCALELQVREEVQAALLDYATAADGVTVAGVAVDLARSAYDVETEKYTAGKSTITEVLSAQADLLDAEASRARAMADSQIALAALWLAIGEGP